MDVAGAGVLGDQQRGADLPERDGIEAGRPAADGIVGVAQLVAAVLAEQTVKSHVSRTFTELGLRDRAQARVPAYEPGPVRPGS
ncbi:hypothetical protein [Pseudonocardia xishanensis]|uniref:HTH luxR-type domain-containing protein n=1 Tax=Pseudonocardia xishanensis TaxID=630995 RepID=A0ABP8RS39_9PSEU